MGLLAVFFIIFRIALVPEDEIKVVFASASRYPKKLGSRMIFFIFKWLRSLKLEKELPKFERYRSQFRQF